MTFKEVQYKNNSILEQMNRELELNESLLNMICYKQYDINDIIRIFNEFEVFIKKSFDSIEVLTNLYIDEYELDVFEIRQSALEVGRKAERLILEIEKELSSSKDK